MGIKQSKKIMKNLRNVKTGIHFFLVLFFLATGMAAESKLYPLVKKIKGQVWSIDKNKESKKIDLNSQFNEKIEIKTEAHSTITLNIDEGSLLTIEENSVLEIPAIEWESRKITDLTLLSGKIFYSNERSEERFLRTLITKTRVTEGEWVLSYNPEDATAQIYSLKGVVDFRGLENEEGVVVESMKKAGFKGVIENGTVVYDELLKGRKVARGLLSEVTEVSPEQLKALEVTKDLAKPEKIVKVKKIKPSKDHICEQPYAKFNQCSWICENNPKSAKKCLVEHKNVQCVRLRCDANGNWVDKSILPKSKSNCEKEPKVAACDY